MKTLGCLFSLILIIQLAVAQDPHFSQYFRSPLTLNPAQTGNITASGRLATNFRNQWQGIGDPFLTGTISLDGRVLKNRLGDNSSVGIGMMGLYDRTAGGMLTSNYLAVSAAYHKELSEGARDVLSIGFQSTLASRLLDYSRISFASQFGSNGFDLSRPSNQNFQKASLLYADWNAGMMFTHRVEESSYHIGVSAYHLTRPRQTFLGASDEVLPMRYNIHAGAELPDGEVHKWILSGMVNFQGASAETLLGLAYGYSLTDTYSESKIFAGTWYRVNDAFIPYVGYQKDDLQVGLTYDILISTLNSARQSYRSYELSVVYLFRNRMTQKCYVPWY